MAEFVVAELDAHGRHKLLAALVVPRPIAWVSSVDAAGRRNLAPHSFYSPVSSDPPIVQFASTHSSPHHPLGHKDTLRNIAATGEFVVSIVAEACLAAMNLTGATCPPEIDEFALAGLAAAPSLLVRPPRVAAAPAALECRLRLLLPLGDATMIIGDVVCIHIADAVMSGDRIAVERLRPVGRLGGPNYFIADSAIHLPSARWEPQPAV